MTFHEKVKSFFLIMALKIYNHIDVMGYKVNYGGFKINKKLPKRSLIFTIHSDSNTSKQLYFLFLYEHLVFLHFQIVSFLYPWQIMFFFNLFNSTLHQWNQFHISMAVMPLHQRWDHVISLLYLTLLFHNFSFSI